MAVRKHAAGSVIAGALAGAWLGLARSAPEVPPVHVVGVPTSQRSLDGALTAVAQDADLRLVVEMPSEPQSVTLAKGRRPAAQVLDELAHQVDAVRVEVNGVVVLRPENYPTADESELAYRHAMEGLVAFLGALSADQRESVVNENWLDAEALPKAQQQRLRAALLDDDPSDEVWRQWAREGKIAAGFLFDPYVQIDGVQGVPGERWFVRTRHRLPAYDRLVPAKRPGAVRPASQEGR